MRAALPTLIAFSNNQVLKQCQFQLHPSHYASDGSDLPPLFEHRRAFHRSLPRGCRLFASSASRSDVHLSVEHCIPECKDGIMVVFQDASCTQQSCANMYIKCMQTAVSYPAQTSSVKSASSITKQVPLKQSTNSSSTPSQLFCYLHYTLPLVAACGHLGSRPTSSASTLEYST